MIPYFDPLKLLAWALGGIVVILGLLFVFVLFMFLYDWLGSRKRVAMALLALVTIAGLVFTVPTSLPVSDGSGPSCSGASGCSAKDAPFSNMPVSRAEGPVYDELREKALEDLRKLLARGAPPGYGCLNFSDFIARQAHPVLGINSLNLQDCEALGGKEKKLKNGMLAVPLLALGAGYGGKAVRGLEMH